MEKKKKVNFFFEAGKSQSVGIKKKEGCGIGMMNDDTPLSDKLSDFFILFFIIIIYIGYVSRLQSNFSS